MGLYDWHFDRDNDGKLDMDEELQRLDFDDYVNKRGLYEEDSDDEDDDLDELELAGLDRDELELMDDDERAEALEDAGLDPDDWDDL